VPEDGLLDHAAGRGHRCVVFPKESVGKMAVAEGSFHEIKLTRAQAVERAKHEAEEKGAKFDPGSVSGPVTIYQIQGTGAVIVD
jgi:hypothetical protein